MVNNCHLSVLVHEQAKRYGSREELMFQSFGSTEWKAVSWNQFSLRVKQVSNSLLNLGLKPQECIGVFSQNCVQYLYTDFGAYGVRIISVPLYATSSEQQIQYMINDAQIRVLFVGEQEQYDKAKRVFPLCHSLERIVVYDQSVHISSHDPQSIYFSDFIKMGAELPRQSEVEQLWKSASMDDVCNILYTSGTTGESKGVVLTYGQYYAALEANSKCVPLTDKDRIIDFLPLTHIFERGWAYLGLVFGSMLILNTNPRRIQEAMRETHPTSMSAVPRFWEKVLVAVKDKIDKSGAVEKKLFHHALEVGRRHNIEYIGQGKRPPLSLALEYKLTNSTVASLVRKQIGLDHPNIFPTAGATVSQEVEVFVHSIGLDIIVGYGLTESLATVSCDHRGKQFTVGSVGRPIEGIEIKISDEGEILLKGPTITRGYFHRDEANKKAFDAEGFFHTGDAGELRDGELFLKERIKDLFKTSNGKYIAPQMIESLILVDKYVDQIAVIADRHKFVSALIVPDYRLIEEYARDHHIAFESREELCANEKINHMIAERIDTLQQQLASYEKVKRITLMPHHFSMENGEMTNTLKLKRNVINKNYKDIIDKMYEEAQQ